MSIRDDRQQGIRVLFQTLRMALRGRLGTLECHCKYIALTMAKAALGTARPLAVPGVQEVAAEP